MATLLDLASDAKDNAQTARDDQQQALASAQTAVADARVALTAATDALSAAQEEVEKTREALGGVETPADAAPLLTNLEQQTIAARAKQAEALDARLAFELGEIESEQAAARLEWASRRLTASKADLAAVQEEDDTRQELKAALDDAPLSAIPSDANDAVNTAPANEAFAAAKARIEADIPAELIARARERRVHRLALRTAQEDGLSKTRALVADELDKKRGVRGKLRRRQSEFEPAEAALRDYVSRAESRLDHARRLLAKVANGAIDPLSAEQTARIADAAVADPAKAAIPSEQAVDAKQLALLQAEVELEEETLKEGPDIAAKQTARDTAQTEFDDAQLAYTADMRTALDTWEAAVPDATWRLLADFEEAHATLLSLAVDPAALKTALTQAETNLANALDNVDKSELALRAREEAEARRATRVELEIDRARPVLFGALRGDG